MLKNPRDVHPAVHSELDGATERALKVGATPPLEYVGAGATAIVFCDSAGQAFKVYRGQKADVFYAHEAEAEWLLQASAAGLPVPSDIIWHPELQVLQRRCIVGRAAGWGTRGVRDTFERIQKVMKKYGWTGPEFKEDSFVVEEESNRLILVDAGFVHRHGDNLVTYIREVLAGQRQHPEDLKDLAWALRMSIPDEIAPAVGEPLHAALEQAAGHSLK